jgi:hypothetical protein
MATSLDAMPVETQLQIFRSLLPVDLDNPDRSALASLRLTCKAVKAAATEVYFERYYLLVRREGSAYVQTLSWELLFQRPDLAALVRSVWIALAAADRDWLRKQAAFGHHTVPDEEKTLELAYRATDMYTFAKYRGDESLSDDVRRCRLVKDFLSAQYSIIREYHQLFIAPHEYSNKYREIVSHSTLDTFLRRWLQILPNAHHVRLVRPPIVHTPFYTERYNFWMEKGFENWAFDLKVPRDCSYPDSSLFPWHPLFSMLGLVVLPSACKSLELGVLLDYWPFESEHEGKVIFEQNPALHAQLDCLSLLIYPGSYLYQGWSMERSLLTWARFVNLFSSLSTISMNYYCDPLTWERFQDSGRIQLTESFLPNLMLPNVRHLNITSGVLLPDYFSTLKVGFPSLLKLQFEKVAFIVPTASLRKKRPNMWHTVARSIRDQFGGECIMAFGSGPFIEHQGHVGNFGYFSRHGDPGITRVMKLPALEILSAISHDTTGSDDLKKRYSDLMKHKRPNVRVTSQILDEREDDDDDYKPRFK